MIVPSSEIHIHLKARYINAEGELGASSISERTSCFCIVCMLSNAKKSPGMHCSRKNHQTIAVTLRLRFAARVNEAKQKR